MNEPTTRRKFLLAATGATAALAGCVGATAFVRAAAESSNSLDPCSREEFDRIDRSWNDGNAQADNTNEGGSLGWGESSALAAYLLMYRAHGDTQYLDKLIDQFDRVLKNRDSVRGVKDYRGQSLPAWQSAAHYTCGIAVLDGVLSVRTAARPAANVTVQVLKGSRDDTFTIRCARAATADVPAVVDVYEDLTLSRSNDRFAPRYINDRFAQINRDGKHLLITAEDWRESAGRGPGSLAPGPPISMRPQPYIYAVHTGMLLQPVAEFIRIAPPVLKYRAKAQEYLDAVEKAVAIFDDEWREDAKTGEGWLVWRHGAPVSFDGSDQPHNQYLALGTAMIHLSAVASSRQLREKNRDRATKMARTLKNDLKRTDAGGFSWPYFWSKGKAYNGWTAADEVSKYQPTFVYGGHHDGHKTLEDSSHAHIDSTFARTAFENGLGVFDEDDMRRFAATYAKQILGGERSSQWVDGRGKPGMYDAVTAVGVLFARWDHSIIEKVTRLYQSLPPAAGPSARLLGTAYLNLMKS